jgi:hypothetical protein
MAVGGARYYLRLYGAADANGGPPIAAGDKRIVADGQTVTGYFKRGGFASLPSGATARGGAMEGLIFPGAAVPSLRDSKVIIYKNLLILKKYILYYYVNKIFYIY